MKKILFIFYFLFFIFYSVFSQNNWMFENPKPTGYNLYAVKFVDNNTVFATGDGGVVLKSTDAGLNWVQSNINVMRTFCGISNYDPSHIALASYSHYTVTSTNKGISWNTSINNLYTYYYQQSNVDYRNILFYTDSNTFYSKVGFLYTSTNGGTNFFYWPPQLYSTPLDIYLINSNTGWIYNDSGIYKSTNNGLNYTRQIVQKYNSIKNFSFLNENYGVLLSSSNPLLITTNSGVNWVARTIDSIGRYFRVKIADSNTIYLCRDSGIVIKSTNGGINWLTLNTGYNESLYSLDFINNNTGVVVGATGCLLTTTNGGINWNQKRTRVIKNDIESFYFINQSTGYFVGDSSLIVKTTNGGADLSVINIGQHGKFFGVTFTDQNTGYIVGEQGRVIKTTDAGNSWSIKYTDTTVWLVDINFVNSTTGFAVGSKQTIFKTTNGGDNWFVSYQGIFSDLQFFKVKFLNSNTGYVGGSSYLFETTDGGENWTIPIPPINGSYDFYNDIVFFGNTVYTIRYNSSYNYTDFLFSTNNGNNWTMQSMTAVDFPGFIPFGVDFISDSTGYICGQGNTIAKTTNKGATWVAEQGAIFPGYVDNANRNRLYKIIVFDTSNIITAGQRGVIFRKGNPLITSVGNKNSTISGSYVLYQNYPNPFNPTTKIKFSIPVDNSPFGRGAAVMTTLKVYDILGREIQTLVNEKKFPGTYEVTFNGSSLASGIYFYKLIVMDSYNSGVAFSETKKLVLLK